MSIDSSEDEESDDSGELNEPPPAKKGSAREVPFKRALRGRVSELCERRNVKLPSNGQTFPTQLSILLEVYSFAHQNSIVLNHHNNNAGVVFTCRRDSRGKRCKYRLEGRKYVAGTWCFKAIELSHDKDAHRGKGRPTGQEGNKRKRDEGAFSRRSQSASKRSRQPQPALLNPGQSQAFPQLSASTSASPSLATPSTLTAPQLDSFLLYVFPSSSTNARQAILTFLSLSGVASITDLTSILSFEDSSVDNLVECTRQANGLSEGDAANVKKTLREIRRSIEAEE
ncbi:hypothetical protein JCM8547_005527 [Rhodosporidiobolus lusitaniae]